MTIARSVELQLYRTCIARSARMALCSLFVLSAVTALNGCASIHREMPSFADAWDPGLEVRFPAAMPVNDDDDEDDMEGGEMAREAMDGTAIKIATAPDRPMPPVHRLVRDLAAVGLYAFDKLGLKVIPRVLEGIPEYGETKYTLIPGNYAFHFDAQEFKPVYGAVNYYPVWTPRARDFIRFTSLAITPSPEGRPSVLTQGDLDRARGGDVVTKVVFVADQRAIRDRLDDIDVGMRELDRVRASLVEQRDYWQRKVTERRLNTRYSSDFGWGVDVPGFDLALLQSLVGPERYHWYRFTQAEDQLRTYEEKMAQLELPERRLREERDALKKILHSVEVIHRSEDLLILASSMIRPYHDPVHEVHQLRGIDVWADSYRGQIPHDVDDWVGPFGKVHFPYWYSSLVNANLMPGLRPVKAPSMALTKPIGEVLMVVQAGNRRPIELGGHSWVNNEYE